MEQRKIRGDNLIEASFEKRLSDGGYKILGYENLDSGLRYYVEKDGIMLETVQLPDEDRWTKSKQEMNACADSAYKALEWDFEHPTAESELVSNADFDHLIMEFEAAAFSVSFDSSTGNGRVKNTTLKRYFMARQALMDAYRKALERGK